MVSRHRRTLSSRKFTKKRGKTITVGKGSPQTARRSKKTFKTARSAWMDVARKTNLKPSQVKSKHTNTRWVWIKK